MDKTDVNNLTNRQKSKTTQTIKIVKRETDGIPADVTYYINGKIATKAEVDKMDPSLIEKMDVDKSSGNAKSIKITTKTVYESSSERTQPEKQIDYNKAIVIIDGKISDSKAMNKLSSDNIKSMDIQKPANGPESVKQAAIAKYGEKALNGIITITTK